MIINRLNNRIKFYEFNEVINDYGEISNERIYKFSLWADVSKSTLKEYRNKEFDQSSTNKMVFLIDHRASLKVDETMWIEFHGDYFNIINIERDYAMQDMTKLTASKVDK